MDPIENLHSGHSFKCIGGDRLELTDSLQNLILDDVRNTMTNEDGPKRIRFLTHNYIESNSCTIALHSN